MWVVPSAQRALAVRLRVASRELAQGRRAWRSPLILSAAAWLERYAQRGGGVELLPELEEWLLFRDCARGAWRSDGEPSTPLIDSLRRSAERVFHALLPERSLAGTPEAEWLARTIRACDEVCAERRATPRYRLPEIASRIPPAPSRERAELMGFTRLTAVQHALIESGACRVVSSGDWRARGVIREGARAPGGAVLCRAVSRRTASGTGRPRSAQDAFQQGDLFSGPRGITAPDPGTELAMASSWAREKLGENPASRLLVLIPDLRRREHEVLRSFSQALEPTAWTADASARATRIGLEGGRTLSEFPLVQSRLALLRRPRGVTPARAFLRWLRSVCADPATDDSLAHLDRWLRGALDADASEGELERVLRRAPGALRPAAESILARLSLLRAARWESPLPLTAWIEAFRQLWRSIALPARAPLSSPEQQVSLRLEALLDELERSISQTRLFDGHAAAALVSAAVGRTRFEPASGDASLTLSATLADPIVAYDGIWVCGLDSTAWPVPSRLDPFIPAALQRSARLPAATPGILAQEADALMRSWAAATSDLTLSWARFQDDVEGQASDIAERFLGAGGFAALHAPIPPLAVQLHRANRVQRFDDTQGIAVSEGGDIPSGSRALQLQAQCAFSAYAQLRLAALPIEENRAGIDPRDRGRFLHSALEELWIQLGSAAGLRAAQADLESHIARALDAAEAKLGWNDRADVSQRHRARERQRLAALLRASCEFDARRADFSDVRCEQPHELTLGGCRLRLRIDRMDRLANGHVAIFDYKSGLPAPVRLTDDRLVDTQLPLYALAATAAGETVDSVALAFVSRGTVNLRGLAADRAAVKVKVSPDWAAQLARWETQLQALAQAFVAGDALRDPVDGACRYCHLQALCRISVLPEEPDFAEEEGDDAAD